MILHLRIFLQICVPSLLMAMLVASDTNFRGRNGRNHNHRHSHGRGGRRLSSNRGQRGRGGRQNSDLDLPEPVQGGVDFSGCETQDGQF